MTATVSSPWGKPGAWALDTEEHEAELRQQEEPNNGIADFPSLATAAAATKTKKKNKGQTLSLAEFNSAKPSQPSQSKGLTHEDLLVLPTGPRQRSAEDLDRSRLGGGFKSYGSNSRYGNNYFGSNSGEDSSNSRWAGSSRVSNKDASRESQPSRADEIDNWAATKRPVSTIREKSVGFFDSQSKADESDSWVSNKNETARSKFGFGGGFERKSSFDSLSRDRERDNWGRKKEESGESERPRPRLVLQPRTVPVSDGAVNVAKPPKGMNPFGEARPREAVLAEKGKDWKEIDEKLEAVKIREEKTEASPSGRRGFGNSGGGFAESRSWRKSEFNAIEQSAVNGRAEEKYENEHTEEKSENGHEEEN